VIWWRGRGSQKRLKLSTFIQTSHIALVRLRYRSEEGLTDERLGARERVRE